MADDLEILPHLTLPGFRLVEETLRAGGPGGQHQNTTESAVRLRYDMAGCQALHPAVKRRIQRACPSQVTEDGELLIVARSHRSQLRNREEARQRLVEIIRAHLAPPRRRIKTRPSRAARRRRLQAKRQRGETKALRGKVDEGS